MASHIASHRPVAVLMLFAAVWLLPGTSLAVTINLIDEAGGNFRFASITSLDIAGTTYDATFSYATAFADLPTPDITFNTPDAAVEAVNAINSIINPFTACSPDCDTALVSGAFYVPYSSTLVATNISVGSGPTRVIYNIGGSGFERSSADFNFAYVTFQRTPAIPEPSAAILFGIGFGVVGVAARRKRIN